MRGLPLDLTEKPTELPVANQVEEIQQQQRGARLKADATAGVEMSKIVAGHPVPARIRSASTSMSMGDTDTSSRNWSPRQRWIFTGAASRARHR